MPEREVVLGTIGKKHQYRGHRHAVEKQPQEILCGLVDPVQVLEHYDLRTRLRRAQKIPPQRIEHFNAPQPRVHCRNAAWIDAKQMPQVRKRGRQLLTQCQHGVLDVLDDVCLGISVFDAEKPSQHVDHGMERHRAPER